MTLAAIWIETIPGGNWPLCFASDSRTTPGPIDGVTKVVLFAREDLAGVWAGDYRYAYLVVNHLDAVLAESQAMRRRDVDVADALRRAATGIKRHLSASTQAEVPSWQRNALAQLPERTTVLVGGYSIVRRAHLVLRVDWNPGHGRWRTAVDELTPADVLFIGDDRRRAKKVSEQARAYRSAPIDDVWRMEPIAAIHNACEDRNKTTIGGSVQLAKAYMHGAARAYAILDPIRRRVTVRAAEVDLRHLAELSGAGALISIGTWRLGHGRYLRVDDISLARVLLDGR
jgi:hypothetical protein